MRLNRLRIEDLPDVSTSPVHCATPKFGCASQSRAHGERVRQLRAALQRDGPLHLSSLIQHMKWTRPNTSGALVLRGVLCGVPVAVKLSATPHGIERVLTESAVYATVLGSVRDIGGSVASMLWSGEIDIHGDDQIAYALRPAGVRQHVRAYAVIFDDAGPITLTDVISSDRVEAESHLCVALCQVFDTLTAFGRLGVMHNDLHPGNIVLNPGQTPLETCATIIDFDRASAPGAVGSGTDVFTFEWWKDVHAFIVRLLTQKGCARAERFGVLVALERAANRKALANGYRGDARSLYVRIAKLPEGARPTSKQLSAVLTAEEALKVCVAWFTAHHTDNLRGSRACSPVTPRDNHVALAIDAAY